MSLSFEHGDPEAPLGHAIIYFRSGPQDILATYALVLPIPMDMGKYLPPLLANQLGGAVDQVFGEGMGSFAAPPVPEKVESVEYLSQLASLRGDDLIFGGDIVLGDAAAAMHEASEAAQQYTDTYRRYIDTTPRPALPQESGQPEAVHHVLYQLMGDRERLAELSKLVGTMRFAAERGDHELIEETDGSLLALKRLLPDHYWVDRVRNGARDTSETAARLVQLYVDRCYRLLEQDFTAVATLESQIADLES